MRRADEVLRSISWMIGVGRVQMNVRRALALAIRWIPPACIACTYRMYRDGGMYLMSLDTTSTPSGPTA